MPEPRDARDAVLEVVLNRLWQDGYIVDVVLTIWAAGYMAGHHDSQALKDLDDKTADMKTGQGQ